MDPGGSRGGHEAHGARPRETKAAYQIAEELSERYHGLMVELRDVLVQLGELAELRRTWKRPGQRSPDDIRDALARPSARRAR
jgi:hypothetical protein